jgi:hypothetical protein
LPLRTARAEAQSRFQSVTNRFPTLLFGGSPSGKAATVLPVA